ncbi:hypothetical protein BDY21DRAFT_417276 [Lineolata rhizophorae]|uniref:Protein kinase domain-containing protein n=1 Tax=Lineolata rhizophorae TaxID=578093 RepID=A0A6A6NNL3_9PEZI|nr:hypothetical protein BDY21DRAFT_417276 [Lineolata rhizophorae]
MASGPPSPIRQLPTPGFVALSSAKKIEEENIPTYEGGDYHPVDIGEAFNSYVSIEYCGKRMAPIIIDYFDVIGPNWNPQILYPSPNNVHPNIEEDSTPAQIEQGKHKRPIARKILEGRTIHNSRSLPGQPAIADLGEAKISHQMHKGDIMPRIYRAQEAILGMGWASKVDIWAVGIVTWGLLEGSHLSFAKRNRIPNGEQHLAE